MRLTRAGRLAWCKQRALQYVIAGDLDHALTSLLADLRTYPETAGHVGISLGTALKERGLLESPAAICQFIHGFN